MTKTTRDFEIITEAERSGKKFMTSGYIVKHDDECYFVFDGDKECDDIYSIDFWATIERHWCFDVLDLVEDIYYIPRTAKRITTLDTEEFLLPTKSNG